MRVTLDTREFRAAVQFATAGVGKLSATSMPVLSGILVSVTEDGTVAVEAFDYEIAVKATIVALNYEPGAVLLPGKLLGEIVVKFKGDNVVIDCSELRNVISSGGLTVTLNRITTEDFPARPDLPAIAGQIDAEILTTALERTVVAVAKKDPLPELSCVQVTTGEVLRLTCTDRYRIAEAISEWKPSLDVDVRSALVRVKILTPAIKLLKGTVSVHLGDRLLGLSWPGHSMTLSVMSGKFPRCDRIMPTSGETFTVDRADLASAVSTVGVVDSEDGQIRIDLEPGTLTLSAISTGVAEVKMTIDVDWDGSHFPFLVNHRYLTEALTGVRDSRIRVMLALYKASTRLGGAYPVQWLLSNAGEPSPDGAKAGYRHLVMLVR